MVNDGLFSMTNSGWISSALNKVSPFIVGVGAEIANCSYIMSQDVKNCAIS